MNAPTETFQDHIDAPYHEGIFPSANEWHSLHNPTCGDEVELQLLIEEGRIIEAWQKTKGCFVNQAAASMLCQYIEGKTIQELKNFQAHDMLNLFGNANEEFYAGSLWLNTTSNKLFFCTESGPSSNNVDRRVERLNRV